MVQTHFTSCSEDGLKRDTTRLRDSMDMVQSANAVNSLAASVPDTGGVYFVTAFSGLLAPYWDPGAAGLLIGSSLFLQDPQFCFPT